MEEKLREILNDNEETISRYEEKIEHLRSRINFCSEHKFEEEKRIALVELNSFEMAVYRFRNMHTNIKEVLDAWES